MRQVRGAAVILACCALAVGCGGKRGSTSSTATPTSAVATSREPGTARAPRVSLCSLSAAEASRVIGEPMRPGRPYAGASAGLRGCTYASVALHVSSSVQQQPNALVVAHDAYEPASCEPARNPGSTVLALPGGCVLEPTDGPRSRYRARVGLVLYGSRITLTAIYGSPLPPRITSRLVQAARRLAAISAAGGRGG